MFKIKDKLKELSFYFTTQLLLIITPIVYIPIVSFFLSPAEFGKASLFLMLMSFSSQLFYGPVSNGINRFYYEAVEKSETDSFFSAIEKIILRISAIVFLILLLLYEFSSILEDFSVLEMGLIYVVIVFFGIYVLYNGVLGVQRQRPKQMVLEIFANMSKLLSIFLIFKLLFRSNVSVILSSLVSLVIAFFLLIYLLKYRFAKVTTKSSVSSFYSSIVKFAVPYALWAPFLTGYFMSDRFLIKHFMSLKDVGNYSIQYQLTFSSMQLLSALMTGFILPILLQQNVTDKSFAKKYALLIKLSLGFILIGLLGGVFLYYYGDVLLHLFLKKEYSISRFYLFSMTLSGGFYGATQILAIKQTLENKNRQLLYFNVSLSVFGLILNYFAIQTFGIDGLVYSLLLLSCLWYLSVLLLYKLK